ncbi:LytR/AlgR family response regulator transcription factor [Saccharicrinis aurantiacus]|uniref:LytR/AlgR family response regulator transcription factor n=1 Tax=Saccharicrinis aurantiacus TaxID=1849719 RepID=UPI00094F75B9|nr:LytTR family DNA-binding domain-containing protein [Saccharicrinis aurantiacus]
MLRTIIVDDENSARQSIKKILEMYLNDVVEVVGMTDNLDSAVSLIKKESPGLVFMDISMPQQSGLDVFNYFDVINFDVVFITAHNQYAVDAVGLGASGYILKPIKPKDLVDTVLKINMKRKTKPNEPKNGDLDYGYSKLMVNHQKGVHIVAYNEIRAIEADGNYCKIYKADGEPLYVSKTIGSVEEKLPESHFFRVHRSCLININYVSEIDKEKNIIRLGELEMPLAAINFKPLIEHISKIANSFI